MTERYNKPVGTDWVVDLRKLEKTYDSGACSVRALKPVDIQIPYGIFCAVMGPSGSGKSTLLNLLGLLDQPSGGQYILNGQDVSHLNDNALSEIRCRQIGMVFQSFNLFPHFTVQENVCVPMRYAGFPEKKMQARAQELLERVGLDDRMKHKPTQLSGGQCQRVAIARALANDPPVILADEPTGNLDEKTGTEILELFHELRDSGRTVIMVTHNPVYETIVERTIVLHDGYVTRDEVNPTARTGSSAASAASDSAAVVAKAEGASA